MSKRVIIVDDDKELCEELAELFNDEGFSVDYAFTHGRAKELLLANAYDVLLLDFKMPQLSGIDFLEELKEDLKETKVFIISGSPIVNNLLAERGLSGSVAEVFAKPFSAESLLEKIR